MQVPAIPVLPADTLRPVDVVAKFRPRSLAGLGQSGETDVEGSDLPAGSWGDYGGETYTVPSGGINTSSPDATTMAFISQLLKQGFSLAQVAAMQPGTVIQSGPGGTNTVLRQSGPGQTPVPVQGFFGGVSAAANSGAGLAVLAAVGIGILFLMGRR